MDLNISEIEFSKIKENIINFLRSDSTFKDYNFEASGLNILIDALAYTTHQLSYYNNISVNEMFLNSAQIRKNIVALAKSLNYIPYRKRGAEAYIDFEIKDDDKPSDPTTEIYINQYTKFVSGAYNFYTTESAVLTNANNYKIENLKLRQGEENEVEYVSNGVQKQIYIIETAKVDNDYLFIYVNDILWTNENDLTNVDDESETYLIEETEDGYVKIIFGDGTIGKIPPVSQTIKLVYFTTDGISGNNLSTFILNEILNDNKAGTWANSKADITTVQQSLSGTEEETINSIKIHAAKWYETYGNLVTTNDWESYLDRHQIVELIHAWGGDEEEVQPKYGTVFLCIKPVGALVLTPTQENTLSVYIDNNINAIRFEFKDPEYIYVDVTTNVFYSNEYVDKINVVQSEVDSIINTYFADDLQKFGWLVKHAELTTKIDDVNGVSNNNTTLQPFFKFSKIGTGSYYWDLKNVIAPGSINSTLSDTESFSDDSNGKIIDHNSNEIGTVDYANGVIEINNYDISADEPSGGFIVYFDTVSEDIYYKKHWLVQLNNTTITMERFTT